MNTPQQMLPLVAFVCHPSKELVILNPHQVVSVYKPNLNRVDCANITCIAMVTGDTHLVVGDLGATRNALQLTPWYAFKKLGEVLDSCLAYMSDREDADYAGDPPRATANTEMHLASGLRIAIGELRQHGFIK
jgi:hypothetical protein